MNLPALWDQLVDAVCRPPRDDAYTEADLVGGRRASFRLYDRKFYRQDVTLVNGRGLKLQGSHYRPCVVTSSDGRLPVVIYLHCNSGSRRDAEEILFHLLPKGITVFAFDFAGSGVSEGGYVTLGAHEVDDLSAVVQYLREEGSSSTIGLWGRSMGAVTALLYSQKDPSVAGMVLDSPFSRLVDLMLELATDQQLRIPKPLIKMALAMLKRSVKKRAGFSVDKVAPLDCVGASFIPALFAHGKDDTFVPPHHSERLFQTYAGDKNFVTFAGEHNSVRPDFFYDSALIFLIQALRVAELVGPQVDLQALPPDQLPHLTAHGNSIYVTASHNVSEDDLLPGGSRPGSPRSRSASPGSPLSRDGSNLSRMLNVPWNLPPGRSASGRHAAELVGAAGAAAGAAGAGAEAPHPLGGGVGQLAALLEASGLEGGGEDGAPGEAGAAAGRFISEEEALQRALELSLQDARQQAQQGQQQQGAEASQGGPLGGGSTEDSTATGVSSGALGSSAGEEATGGADRQLPHHMRYNQAFATSGAEGQRNPLYGGTSAADVPATADEEEAMLAAALAASLSEAPAAAEQGAVEAAAAGVTAGSAAGEAAEVERYLGRTGGTAAGAPFGAAPAGQPGQQEGAEVEGEPAALAADRTSSLGSQAMADAHAGQEAAAAKEPALQLQRAMSDAVAAAAEAAPGSGAAEGGGAAAQ